MNKTLSLKKGEVAYLYLQDGQETWKWRVEPRKGGAFLLRIEEVYCEGSRSGTLRLGTGMSVSPDVQNAVTIKPEG